MGDLREIGKMAIFIPSIAWFLFVALTGNFTRNYEFMILINFTMCVGFFLITGMIYVYGLKPSFLKSQSKDCQGQGSKEGQAHEQDRNV